jgi:acyl dehydratase
MNLNHVSSLRFAPTDQDYDLRDTLLYALSLGMGSDPLDADEQPYVFEGARPGGPYVVPSQCMILGWIPFWQDDPATGIQWKRILHGEERFQIHRPLPVSGRVQARHHMAAVSDKGLGRGAVVQVDTALHDRDSGDLLATLQSMIFMRDDGGCGHFGTLATPLPAMPSDARPDAVMDIATSPQSALLYRAISQDWMPLHADPAIAREAGFEVPISHGLNNLGRACRAVLKHFAPGRPDRLQTFGARFISPGLPGDTVRVSMFLDAPERVRFRADAVERGVCLIDRGVCELAA